MAQTKVKETDLIVCWFSCGAASAVAAKVAIDLYPGQCRIVNNPVIEEHPDNARFLRDVQDWLGVKIEFAINDKYPACSAREVWEKRKFMASNMGAPCTNILKKEARQQFEKENKIDWHVMGFTAEEKERHERFTLTERSNVLPLLIDKGITKPECCEILSRAGIELPEMYKMGYPNANCIGCVKASSPEYWKLVKRMHPDVFEDRAKQSREIGAKLVRVKGDRIYLDEMPENAQGRPIKDLQFECGIFCEEYK